MKNHLRSHHNLTIALLLCCVGVAAFGLNWRYWRAAAAIQNDPVGQASPDGIWQSLGSRQAEGVSHQARAFRLNQPALTAVLDRAPLEFTTAANNAPTLALPLPDGSFQRFRIEESPIMEPALAARFPEIKTYRAQGIDDPGATGRLTWSPRGFYAFVLRGTDAVSIQLANTGDTTVYVSYASQDQPADTQQLRCLVGQKEQARATKLEPDAPAASVGGTLRVYRVAIATTVEYTNQANLGGGTVGGALASIGIWLTGVNAIMEKEVAVRLVLVGNNNQVIFTTEPDGFTNSDESTMLAQAPGVLSVLGVNNFDIGHVFGTTANGGAGIAGLGVLCDNSDFGNGVEKGKGATRFSGPSGQSGQLGVVAHEFGHQFGASHTFNALEASGNCDVNNREGTSAFETGSGSTLMSYGGICNTNNLSGKEFRLHAGSFGQIIPVLNNATCNMANWIATGNNVPTINAGGNFTIPARTPFQLTASGTDPDAADVPNLTYTWDQIDAGSALYPNPPYGDQPGDPNTTTRPLFRSYPASSNPARLFPSLSFILNNANVPPPLVGGFITGENPPSVSRTMNFRATVRDNRGNGGGVNEATAVITVVGASGPFAITSPNSGENITGGAATNVTWNVAGTTGGLINTAEVRISLSTDGGNTFPTVLATSTPNDGNQSITLPNGVLSTTARLKIEAVGNIFFDISDGNFTLTPGDGCPAVSGFTPGVSNAGGQVVLTGINFTGVTAVNFTGANVACPSANCTVNSNIQITLTVPAGAMTGPLTVVKPGCNNLATATLIVCPNAAVTLQIDDGTVNTRGNNGDPAYYVNRLTPAAYPATLSQVQIFFPGAGSGFNPVTSVLPTTPITVVSGGNTTGSPNNTTFQTLETTVGALDTFVTYQLPSPVTITSGDFIVGFIANTPGLFPAAVDSTTNGNRSFTSTNGTSFNAITGNYMIRARVFTGDCGGPPPACPTVTNLNPTNGVVGSSVTITGTNYTGITGVRFSNNVPATVTNNTGTQLTVTVPAGAVTGPITVSKTGCTDVQTAMFTVTGGCPTITLTPPPLPAGTVNTAYNQTVTASGGTGPYNFTLMTGNVTTSRFDATGPVNIPDNNPAGVDLPVAVTGITSPLTKVTVALRVTHTYDEDLTLQLIAPDATTVNLSVKRGGSNDNYGTACAPDGQRTTFDDAAATPITAGAAPFVGTFRPEQMLAAFNGKSGAAVNGQWKLHVIDDTADDTGAIQCVSLFLTSTQPAPGLALATNGALSGTPTTAGTFNFTVKATDANNCMGTQAYALTVNPAGGECPTVTNLSSTNGLVGSSVTITGTNFTGVTGVRFSNNVTATITNNTGTQLTVTVPAGAVTGPITISKTGCADVQTASFTVNANGLQFYPLPAPVRLLETRSGFFGCTNPGVPINANGTLTLPAQGACSGIPANAAAVTGNITVVPQGPGFLTLFPSSAAQPQVANSNFANGEITNNVFTVGLGAGDGAFKIFSSATTHVIADVTGYYAPPGAGGLYFHPLPSPVRLLETRTGLNGCIAPGTPLIGTGNPSADPNLDLAVQGRSPVASPCNSIPATAEVLVGNATSVLPSGGGYLTIYPSGGTRPTVASSNYAGSDVINGPFTVKLGADGKFRIYTFRTTHLVVDILGYFSADAIDANGPGLLFYPLPSPVRLLETRPDFPGFPLTGCTRTNAKIQGNLNLATHTQSAGGFCGLPATAQAVVGNVSVVNSEGAGFLTLFPGNLTIAPLVATSNYPAPATFGYNRHYFVGLGPANGTFKILTQFTTDLILDASGYFAP